MGRSKRPFTASTGTRTGSSTRARVPGRPRAFPGTVGTFPYRLHRARGEPNHKGKACLPDRAERKTDVCSRTSGKADDGATREDRKNFYFEKIFTIWHEQRKNFFRSRGTDKEPKAKAKASPQAQARPDRCAGPGSCGAAQEKPGRETKPGGRPGRRNPTPLPLRVRPPCRMTASPRQLLPTPNLQGGVVSKGLYFDLHRPQNLAENGETDRNHDRRGACESTFRPSGRVTGFL